MWEKPLKGFLPIGGHFNRDKSLKEAVVHKALQHHFVQFNLNQLITHASTARDFGSRAYEAVQKGSELLAFHSAKMSHKWAMWAIQDMERIHDLIDDKL